MKHLNDILWHGGSYIFFAAIGLSLWGVIAFQTPMNAPFYWIWKFGAIPILGIGWLYGYFNRSYFLDGRRVSKGKFWFCLLLTPPLALLFGGGITSLVNGSFPTSGTVTYLGPITERFVSNGRSKGYHVRLKDKDSFEKVTLDVSHSEYNTLQVGQTFTKSFKIGLFGIPSTKRGDNNPVSEMVP